MARKINFTGSALEVLTCTDVKAYILGYDTEAQRLVHQMHPNRSKTFSAQAITCEYGLFQKH